MKKLLLIALCIVNCALCIAQKECKTIAELRQQKNDTEVLYTGTATTTFYGPGGILIQDETGYIYVRNGLLSEWGSSKVKTNMKISEIYGTFKTATSEEMTQIDIEFNEDVQAIVIKEQNVSFNITDIALNDFLANPMSYECQPIRLTDVEVTDVEGSKFIGSGENKVRLVSDYTLPAQGTFEGYYGNNFSQGFIIPSEENIIPTAFKTINDLKMVYEVEAPTTELGLTDATIVNYVKNNNDGSADLYVQQSDLFASYGIILHVENFKNNINEGDSIKGIKGIFTPFTADDNNNVNGSKITIPSKNVELLTVVNKNNKLKTTNIDDIEYIIGWGTKNYEATLSITPKGKIEKKDNQYYLTSRSASIALHGIDMSKFEGENVAICGIIDAGNINSGKTTIILRSEEDVIATNYSFNSIAEMKAAGEPLATGTTYSLKNNVLVTHVHSWKTEYSTIYGMFIQDATAGLYVETTTKPNVVAGDSVKGISGSYHGYITLKDGSKPTVVSSDNLSKIKPEEVTMATLAANPEKYASCVVKLIGVGHDSRTENHYGENITINYLYQGEFTMDYDIWNYNLYEFNNIIGVFDYGSYKSFSIVPLSQDHIEKGVYIATNVDNTNIDNNLIFTQEKQIVAPFAQNIKVFTTNGQLIGETNNDTFDAKALPKGVYIVLTKYDNNTKTTKIINF